MAKKKKSFVKFLTGLFGIRSKKKIYFETSKQKNSKNSPKVNLKNRSVSRQNLRNKSIARHH